MNAHETCRKHKCDNTIVQMCAANIIVTEISLMSSDFTTLKILAIHYRFKVTIMYAAVAVYNTAIACQHNDTRLYKKRTIYLWWLSHQKWRVTH